MKKTHKQLLLILIATSLTQIIGLSVTAQTTVSNGNAEPDFLAPASATAVAASAQAQAAGSASQGSHGNVTGATGAYEQHYTYQNPTTQNNNLGLHSAGFGGMAPVFGF